MPHQVLSHLLQDSRLHQACVERVPEVVKASVRDTGAPDGGFPGGLHLLEGPSSEGEDESFRLAATVEQIEEPGCQGDFPGFTTGGFRVRDAYEAPVEIDMLPTLREELASAHAAIERRYDHVPEVRGGGRKELLFLSEAEEKARLAPGPH